MCVQLEDGIVSVSCTGGAIRAEGCELWTESTRWSCGTWGCVCVRIFQRVSLDKWSPTFGRIVLPSSWTVNVIFVDPDSCNENTAIVRYVGIDAPTDIASLLRRLSFFFYCAQCRTVMNTGLWCRCLLAITEFVFIQVGNAVLHKNLLG